MEKIVKGRFNTSHVTLYPLQGCTLNSCSMFQYISCYSLSEFHFFRYSVNPPFQYISCYSLSNEDKKWHCNYLRFNTSHVTLYQLPVLRGWSDTTVSIHLMLLFIGKGSETLSPELSFNTSHVTLYQNIYQL